MKLFNFRFTKKDKICLTCGHYAPLCECLGPKHVSARFILKKSYSELQKEFNVKPESEVKIEVKKNEGPRKKSKKPSHKNL